LNPGVLDESLSSVPKGKESIPVLLMKNAFFIVRHLTLRVIEFIPEYYQK
jgi:hypothetical protein